MELNADEVTFWDVPRSTRKHRRQHELIFLPCICIKLSQITKGAGKIALWLGVLEIYVQIPALSFAGAETRGSLKLAGFQPSWKIQALES